MLAAVLALVACCSCRPSSSVRPNVLLITIDTLRTDALGWIGGRNETPALDALARDGARFRFAVTPVPLTLPAHVSIMTALLPRRHGVRDNGMVLSATPPTLAERLRANGYATAAFVSGYPLRALFGLDRGFERYDDTLPAGSEGWLERPADQTTTAALAWLDSAPAPWFAWVHYYDPHDPYVAHPEFPRSGPRGAYDSEVAFVDHAVSTLLDRLERRSAAPLLVVMTADHGESFGEHGEWLHGFFLYDSTTIVPLVVRFPGRVAPGERAGIARLVDLAPTIDELVGLPPMEGVDGESLVADLDGRPGPPRIARLETLQPWLTFGWSPLRAVRTAEWKLIDAPRPELYDLRNDPYETRDAIGAHEDQAHVLRESLAPVASDPAVTATRTVDPDAQRRLEALGYVTTAPDVVPPAGLPDPKDKLAERTALLEAEALLRGGEYRDAVARFEAVLATDPANPFATLRSGVALLKAGNLEEAIPRLEQAVRRAPEQGATHYALADALTRTERYEAAIGEWRETVRLQPRRVAAWSNLGTVLGVVGRPLEARQALERAVALAPEDARLLVNLALIERRLGDEHAAAAHFAKASEIQKGTSGTATPSKAP